MSSVNTEYISDVNGNNLFPIREKRHTVVQYYDNEYSGGSWNPTNTWAWIPGCYVDFTPKLANSRIIVRQRLPVYWDNAGSSHEIGHYRFYANGVLIIEGTESGTHIEHAKTYQFECASWGTTQGRIGLQWRSYSNDNNELRLFSSIYWDGNSNNQHQQVFKGHLMVEEMDYQ